MIHSSAKFGKALELLETRFIGGELDNLFNADGVHCLMCGEMSEMDAQDLQDQFESALSLGQRLEKEGKKLFGGYIDQFGINIYVEAKNANEATKIVNAIEPEEVDPRDEINPTAFYKIQGKGFVPEKYVTGGVLRGMDENAFRSLTIEQVDSDQLLKLLNDNTAAEMSRMNHGF